MARAKMVTMDRKEEDVIHEMSIKCLNDIALPVEGPPKCSTSGLAVFISDLETGEERKVTKSDLSKFIRLTDALDGVGYAWTSLTLSEQSV